MPAGGGSDPPRPKDQLSRTAEFVIESASCPLRGSPPNISPLVALDPGPSLLHLAVSKGELVSGRYPSESECTQPLATRTLSTILHVVFAPSSVSIGFIDDSLDEPGNERTLTGTLPVNRSLGIRVRSYTRFCIRNLSSASRSGTVTLYCPLTSLPLLPRVLAGVCLRSYGILVYLPWPS